MNREKIIALLEDGAYLVIREFRLYHPSFRKGYRSVSPSDVSFQAAERVLRDRLCTIDGVIKLA